MPSIDDKVVNMSFDNTKFESGVKTTISSLDKLKEALTFKNTYGGLDRVSKSLGHFQFKNILSSITGLGSHIDEVGNKLHTLRLIGISVLSQIATRAVFAGAQMVKAFTLGPIIQGMDIYKTKLQAIQTILANTQAAGTKMSDVTKALQELNVYSNKTIYSFGQMTKNIGTFTAAGVALKPAVASIKGIANLAALSGSNSEQAATAMYQLSQAISAGQVHLQDWNSVVNAGMGGAVFQRALATTAQAMGKLTDGSVKLVGPMKNVQIAGESFRQSLQTPGGGPSWLTSDVLTKTLATFTGDMTDAQLAATGFNKEQIKQIQQTAQTAENAATQVKTFSQLMDVSKETIATGWSQTFEIVIGNLNEAKKLFTDISIAISNFAGRSAKARNDILQGWKDLGGRTVLLDSLKRAFHALGEVLKPIREAFRDIFPRQTSKSLYELTQRFSDFTKRLIPSTETVKNLHRTFAGIFAALDIGRHIVKGFIDVFINLFHAAGGGTGGFLSLTAKIGDFLVALDQAVRKGKGLQTFFDGLTKVLVVPINLLHAIAHAIANMFSGFSPGGFSNKLDGVNVSMQPFKKTVDAIVDALQGLGPAITQAVQSMNFEAILQVIRTGLLAALVLMLRHFIGGATLAKTLNQFGNKIGFGFAKGLTGGPFGKLGGAFGSLTGSLKAMQHSLQAQTLERIAIAIALLSASLFTLSLIKPKRLHSALGAMAFAIGELIGAMIVLNKTIGTVGSLKLTAIGAALIEFSLALDLMALAILTLGKLSWSELEKGLIGIGGALVAIAIGMKLMPKGLIFTSISMNILAVALNGIALAVRQFGSMNLSTLGKGLGAIALALVGIAIGMKLMPKGLIFTSTSMVILAAALNGIALAVKQFGNMSLSTLGKGLLGIGGALVAIAIGMKLMPKGLIFTSTSMLILAAALNGFALALERMGGMSPSEIAKSLITLAGALIIIAGAMKVMSGKAVFGAPALVLISGAIFVLAEALSILGKLSLRQILQGLIGLAATFIIIGTAANVMSESIPALLGFGAALVVIGAGLALAGAGVALIGIGLSAIAVSGATAVGVLIQALIDLSRSIGEIGENVILGLLHILEVIEKVAPKFVKAAVTIIDIIAKATIKSAPKIAEALVVVLTSALQALARHAPEIIQAGFDILIALLKGIKDNLPEVVTTAVDVIVTFVKSLAKNINRLVRAGFTFIIAIVKGIYNNIGRLATAATDAFLKFVEGLGKDLKKVVDKGAKIISKLVEGLGKNAGEIVKAAGTAVATFLSAVGDAVVIGAKGLAQFMRKLGKALVIAAKSSKSFFNSAGEALLVFLEGFDDAVKKYTDKIVAIGVKIGIDLAYGIAKGLALGVGKLGLGLADAVVPGLHFLRKKVQKEIESHSPSRVYMRIGKSISDGLIIGVKDNLPNAYPILVNFVRGLAKKIENTTPVVRTAVNNLNSSMMNLMNNIDFANLLDVQPTITPVLDLSSIEKDARGLNDIFNKNPIGSVSLSRAALISSEQAAVAAQAQTSKENIAGGDTNVKFEQNNYSPKALDDVEIYRRTRNQLARLRPLAVPSL